MIKRYSAPAIVSIFSACGYRFIFLIANIYYQLRRGKLVDGYLPLSGVFALQVMVGILSFILMIIFHAMRW